MTTDNRLVKLSLTITCAFWVCLVNAQMNYDQAWTKVQADRAKASKVLDSEKASVEDIKRVLADLTELKKWCQSEGIRDIKDSSGSRAIYFQRFDILVDQTIGFARIKDTSAVLTTLNELASSLTAPDSWLQGKDKTFFALYADMIQFDQYIAKLLPNPEIDVIIHNFRKQDPDFIFRGVPYVSKDVEVISLGDRVAGLSMIWSEAKYNFANFDLVKNLDWDASYQKFLPLAAAASDRYTYYNLLREFISLLQDGHSDIGLPRGLRLFKETRPAIPVMLVDGKVVVWDSVAPEFQKLGIQKGDVIERIEGLDAVEYGKKKWGNLVSASTPQDHDIRVFENMLLKGQLGKSVSIETSGPNHSSKKITVPRDGKLKPPVTKPYEFKLFADGTAYFAFNTCENNVPSSEFAKLLPEIIKAGKLVIDCRMNGGGNSGVGYSILSHLIDKKVKVNEWSTRVYRPSFRVWSQGTAWHEDSNFAEPEGPFYSGPVVVLSGPRSFSAAEDFLAGFKMSKRGPIIGMPSGGSTGQPASFPIPGGGWARVCTKKDRMGDGTEFVGKGVIPDIRVETTIDSIRKGRDPQLEAAIKHLNK